MSSIGSIGQSAAYNAQLQTVHSRQQAAMAREQSANHAVEKSLSNAQAARAEAHQGQVDVFA